MNKYEFTVVYKAEEPQRSEAVEAVEALSESKKVNVLNRKEWGLKTLAYEIDKCDKGFYIFYEVEMDGQEIASIERELRLNPTILRHLFVKEVYHKIKRRPFNAKPKTQDEESDAVVNKDEEGAHEE